MANIRIGGFRWVRSSSGSGTAPREVMQVASAYGVAIYKGDPVKRLNDGTVAIADAGDTDIYGIADGAVQYWDGNYMQRGNYLPVSTYSTNLERKSLIYVIPARNQTFEVDADDATTATTEATYQALVGENADHIAAAGSTTTGRSGYQLDISDHKTTTAQWRIVGLQKNIDQDFSSVGVKLLVECNEGGATTFTTSGI